MKYIDDAITLAYDAEKCTGCRRCTEVCPHRVFLMVNKKAMLVQKERCIECGACASNCEFGAITVKRGVGCAVAVINGMITGSEPSCDCSNPSSDQSCC